VLRLFRRLPFFRVLALAQIALLARDHLQRLTPDDRRRLGALVRGARHLTPAERTELRALAGKLEPGAFAGGAARRISPVGFPFRRR
jgi:hypothetical protein